MKTLIFISIVFLTSCTTLKWKKNYYNKHLTLLWSKYNIPDSFAIHIGPDDGLITQPLEQLKRREIKTNLKIWSKIIARIPDSIFESANNIDSFYFNKEKIVTLKKAGLQSSNVHFME